MSNLELGISTPKVDYALGHCSRELDRLSFQGTVFAPYTRHFLIDAGLTPGMRVLDVGSGSGDHAQRPPIRKVMSRAVST